MSRLDANKAEYGDGDEFGNGAHEVFEWFRGCEFGILLLFEIVEEYYDAV